MEQTAYILCAVAALACSLLLWRGYSRRRVRLLLWCSLFFLALTLENVILFIDVVLLGPDTDLSLLRHSVALIGVMLLLYGLAWETG
jgi:hypothetical protein